MFVMCTDETNLDPTDVVKFFVYGGLILDSDRLESMTRAVGEIRVRHGFRPADSLKFRTSSRPAHIDAEEWTVAKAETIEAGQHHGAVLVACLVLHRIARGRQDVLIEWQLNTVLDKFNLFLAHRDDAGFVVMDRLARRAEYALMRRKFTEGRVTPWGVPRQWSQILGYAATCDGASHLNSATDVVLGTLAYCINQRGDLTVPKRLFPTIEPLIWRRTAGNSIWDHGLVLNPARVDAPTYRDEYAGLKRHCRQLA